jgi:hypothetical protein
MARPARLSTSASTAKSSPIPRAGTGRHGGAIDRALDRQYELRTAPASSMVMGSLLSRRLRVPASSFELVEIVQRAVEAVSKSRLVLKEGALFPDRAAP